MESKNFVLFTTKERFVIVDAEKRFLINFLRVNVAP